MRILFSEITLIRKDVFYKKQPQEIFEKEVPPNFYLVYHNRLKSDPLQAQILWMNLFLTNGVPLTERLYNSSYLIQDDDILLTHKKPIQL